jgi:protoporphyrinogen oxidase
MLPDSEHSSLGMEYFCNEGDELWASSNEDLLVRAERELRLLNLVGDAEVVDGTVIRQPKAYPVYDGDYQEALEIIRNWLDTFANLQAIGRNGMHRYNNQDHSMLTAMLAVKNILGENHDLWSVNVEQEYHEEANSEEGKSRRPHYGERLQPTRVLAQAI